MDSLPLELVQRILTCLDLDSLRHAALSCRTFLNSFKNAEVLITSEILLHHIDPSVLPEAILVNESFRLQNTSIDQRIQFAQNHLSKRIPASSRWRLVDALPLVHFHQFVDYLASSFATEAFDKQPQFSGTAAPSQVEICRFQRAFYRFQLYCNVVGRDVSDEGALRDLFFDYFAAWENEQLACVNDYLMRLVAKPFNHMVDYDVTWGYMKIPYINAHYSEYGQYLISEGLENIYKLSTGSGYDDYHDILSNGEERIDEPLATMTFLNCGLERAANKESIIAIDILAELDEDDRQYVTGSPFYDEPDLGPVSIWEWVHQAALPGHLVANFRVRQHRQWAYVFWDCSRLEDANFPTDPNFLTEGPVTELELEQYNDPERLARLRATQRARTQGSRDLRGQIRPYKPQSLESAKEFLRGF
ncbi:uncharacterized protein PG998_006350 [Apiospora kogelbergensis]|uniref:uncharacterized protein n=1 Tax=Apiospora kogelbergensis TaxID=1337665 RepID=UPI0031316A17